MSFRLLPIPNKLITVGYTIIKPRNIYDLKSGLNEECSVFSSSVLSVPWMVLKPLKIIRSSAKLETLVFKS